MSSIEFSLVSCIWKQRGVALNVVYFSVGGADYGSVRIGTFMGMKMIKSKASTELTEMSAANGLNSDEVEQDDIELLKQETSLDYLCNLTPHR